MTDTLKEQLSACLDGQLPDAELDLLLKRCAQDQQLRRTLGRYALAGEALRGAGAVGASAGFADKVAAAVAAEEAVQRRGMSVSPAAMRWLRPFTGAAVAAGVAAVAVMALQAPSPDTELTAETQSPGVSASADSYIVPASTVNSFVPATRLTNYVVAHSEYSSPLGRRTVLSGVLSEEDEPVDALQDDRGAFDGAQGEPLPIAVQRP